MISRQQTLSQFDHHPKITHMRAQELVYARLQIVYTVTPTYLGVLVIWSAKQLLNSLIFCMFFLVTTFPDQHTGLYKKIYWCVHNTHAFVYVYIYYTVTTTILGVKLIKWQSSWWSTLLCSMGMFCTGALCILVFVTLFNTCDIKNWR